MMRQERFTEQAQQALATSQELVHQYQHSQWDVEHILLALLMQQHGLVGDILKELNIDVEVVRNRVEAILSRVPKVTYETGQIYATPRVAQLLKRAGDEADRLKDDYVTVEHLLLAISQERSTRAAEILSSFGVTRDQMMARHRANHIQVAYGTDAASADGALAAKAAMFDAMGIAVHLCGDVPVG